MKVLYFTPRPFWLDFGGQEVQLLKTKDALKNLGVEVLFADYFNETQIEGVDLVHFFGSDYVYAQIAKRLLAKKIPYCVSSIFYPMGIYKYAHLTISRVPYTQSNLRRFLLRNATYALPNSKSEALLLNKLFGIPNNNISIVPNAVDKEFRGTSPCDFVKKYFNDLPPLERFVLSVGRIEKRKNSLLTAEACIKQKIPVVFIGRPAPTEIGYTRTFFSYISKFPLQIKYIPFLTSGGADLANAYTAAHVHCLNSDMETPGLSSLEAGLNGANLVVGDCPPVKEYFEGIAEFASPSSLKSLIQKLSIAFSKNRNCYNQSEKIAENYSWEIVGSKMLSIYHEIITKKE